MDDRQAIPVGQHASAVHPHRNDDYATITVVQGTPVDVWPSPTTPFGRPASDEAQARRYMPLETSETQESTGQCGLQCVLVVLRAPVAALLAINYALGFVLYSLCMAVAAALLLLAQVTSVPFYAIFRTSRQFSSHCAELCSLSRQARMLAPHPVGIRAVKALARWATGGDTAFRDVIGWTSERGCSCCSMWRTAHSEASANSPSTPAPYQAQGGLQPRLASASFGQPRQASANW